MDSFLYLEFTSLDCVAKELEKGQANWVCKTAEDQYDACRYLYCHNVGSWYYTTFSPPHNKLICCVLDSMVTLLSWQHRSYIKRFPSLLYIHRLRSNLILYILWILRMLSVESVLKLQMSQINESNKHNSGASVYIILDQKRKYLVSSLLSDCCGRRQN